MRGGHASWIHQVILDRVQFITPLIVSAVFSLPWGFDDYIGSCSFLEPTIVSIFMCLKSPFMIQVHLLFSGPSTTSTGLNLRLEFLEDTFAIVHFPAKYLTINKNLLYDLELYLFFVWQKHHRNIWYLSKTTQAILWNVNLCNYSTFQWRWSPLYHFSSFS